jgi:hypothetical protein
LSFGCSGTGGSLWHFRQLVQQWSYYEVSDERGERNAIVVSELGEGDGEVRGAIKSDSHGVGEESSR